MTAVNYDDMDLDELRRYMLTYREDVAAFHAYVDRATVAGRVTLIDVDDPDWEAKLDQQLQELHPPEDESKSI